MSGVLGVLTNFGWKYLKCDEHEGIKIARQLLNKMADDQFLMYPGRRNDDTVNLMICCKIIGVDPDGWLLNAWNCSSTEQKLRCITGYHNDHKYRVEPYLDTWCYEGEEWKGLEYLCSTDYTKGFFTNLWINQQNKKEENK